MQSVRHPLLRVLSAAVAALTCVARVSAQDGGGQSSSPIGSSSSVGSPYAGAPWGVQLAPGSVGTQPRLPTVQARPANHASLVPAASAASWSPERPMGSALTQPTPDAIIPAPSDAVYLDSLQPAGPPDIRMATLADQTITPPNELGQVQPTLQALLPPGARDGVFQKIYFTGTWLPAMSNEPDSLGFSDLETGVVFGFPFFQRDTPLLVTPFFNGHLLDNAGPLDVPSTLYDAAVEFRHLRKFGGGPWAMDVAATVGYYSDFEQSSSDAIRPSGRGLVVYESSPALKWIFGVAYLNRAGASVMPVAGAIWEPSPDMRVEAIFPKPKVLWQLDGSVTDDQRWVYVGGEFGGGVWSVTRPSNGELDLISYSDWRLLAGYERKVIGGLTRRFEVGYVFNRELEYENATPDVNLDDTLFARIGVSY